MACGFGELVGVAMRVVHVAPPKTDGLRRLTFSVRLLVR